MRLLYQTDRNISISSDLKEYSEFAEPNEIKVTSNTEESQKYLEQVILNQKHVDLIIIEFANIDTPESDVNLLASWVRQQDTIFSLGNFQIKSIPIILSHYNAYWNKTPFQTLYDGFIYFELNPIHKNEVIRKAIKDWREKIAHDLDTLDLGTNLNFNSVDVKWMLNHRAYKLKVLSEEFIRKQSHLNYFWFGSNIKSLETSIEQFDALIKVSERNPRLRNEKEFHACFRENEKLIIGDCYSHFLYEKQLYYPNSLKYIESDIINISHNHLDFLPEIFEVKLPNQRLVRHNKRTYYRNFTKSIDQVAIKYLNYLSNEANAPEFEKKIKIPFSKCSYTLLIGRSSERDENEYIIRQTMEEKNITILTFDDIIERYYRMYERNYQNRVL